MDLGVDCRICTCCTQIQGLSRTFDIKFQTFKALLCFAGLSRSRKND